VTAPGPRVCVIGAGSSGIASCQVLHARGIDFDCFEKGSEVGGNWRYGNDNGMSSAYESLFINTSRKIMEYATYPMPKSYPDYPHHTQIAAYFDDYVDHFGFRDRIGFRTEVTRVERAAAGAGWDVTVRPADDGDERTERYDAVMVANGHHWDPRWPEPPFPGELDDSVDVIHAHYYRTPDGYEDKNVLVLGIGNSACDIAVETSRVSRMTYLSMRRGAWIVPKYVGSKPADELAPSWATRLPFPIQRFFLALMVNRVQGDPTEFGLPKPDHRIAEAHPTVSSDLLPRIGHGRITVKPNIARLEGDSVRFEDGSVQQVDKVVYCTGYKISFPFLDAQLLDPSGDNRIELYRRVVHPRLDGLYFIGLIQPLGAIMPIAELQSEWIADVVQGRVSLPSKAEQVREIAREQSAMRKRYVASKRHTIQVDFWPYLRQLKLERRRTPATASGGRPGADDRELQVA
jgi:dimethylaniline monooxygenase (N-oxide forming)